MSMISPEQSATVTEVPGGYFVPKAAAQFLRLVLQENATAWSIAKGLSHQIVENDAASFSSAPPMALAEIADKNGMRSDLAAAILEGSTDITGIVGEWLSVPEELVQVWRQALVSQPGVNRVSALLQDSIDSDREHSPA